MEQLNTQYIKSITEACGIRARAKKYEIFRTPSNAYRSLLDYRPEWFEGVGFDPSAGDGRMLAEIISRGNTSKHHANDIRKEERDALKALPNCKVTTRDYLKMKNPARADFMITNPPFSQAVDFVDKAVSHVAGPICILQHMNWLGSAKRAGCFKPAGLKYICHLIKRPHFEVDSGDKIKQNMWNYAWFIFMPDYCDPEFHFI